MPSNSATKIEIRDAKGRPFFPFGFYYYYNLNSDQRMEALREISANGFNTINVSWSDLDDYDAFLDKAEQLSVNVITALSGFPNNNKSIPFKIVKQFKNKPSVVGWSVADDAGDHESSDQILDFHKKIKALDPEHFTYISISNYSKNWAGYVHVADLIGGQSYPIGHRNRRNVPNNLPNELSEVSYVFNVARAEAEKHHRPVIANLQTFNWISYLDSVKPNGERWPSADEVYNMTYQALLAGVKGILFYTYQDNHSRIKDKPEIWNQVKSIVPEINRLTPVLLEGTFTKLGTNFGDVLAGQWTHGRSVYVVVLSISTTETRQVSIPICTKATSLARPLFHGRPSGMGLKEGKLTGLIRHGEVHVYQLSND